MKKILMFKLKFFARLIIRKYRPQIIGITGSIGKTSAKEAIYFVLQSKFNVRMSPKNYNSEIGLPLSIIGAAAGGRDPLAWLYVFWCAVKLLLVRDKDYPSILILEMGVDHPGDMAYLTSIAPPMLGVVTGVSYAHLEFFGSLENTKKEKQVLIEQVDKQGLSILNYDNEYSREMTNASCARVLTYGLKEGADLRAQDLVFNFTKGNYELAGINFKLNDRGSIVPVFMKNIITHSAIYAALVAAAVGRHLGLNLVEIAKALSDYSLPPGRMNILPGIKHTFIIDDTYNSSPEAAIMALDILSRLKIESPAAKYAVLGDMLELGSYTEEGHREVGIKAGSSGLDCLIAVGERSRALMRGASEAGLDDGCLFYFDKAEEAGRFLQNRLKVGDIVLVKGSQGMRMERIVKEIMAEPEQAEKLLVRQGKDWENN